MISVLDMMLTSLGIHFGFIEEANPFMKWHLKMGGILLFASVKILMTSVFILVLETIWDKKMVKRALLKKYYFGAILLYISIYIFSLALVHKDIFI
ncbi:hypothetical protein GW950_01740 [Candidatus Wolfebacteria bacterium]|nr:hypothetical protein [Candidatus Wolfebacteria bacterium]